MLREKSNCVVCRTSKSTKKNFSDNIDCQIVSSNYKTCISIVKTVKSIKHVSKKIRPDFKE